MNSEYLGNCCVLTLSVPELNPMLFLVTFKSIHSNSSGRWNPIFACDTIRAINFLRTLEPLTLFFSTFKFFASSSTWDQSLSPLRPPWRFSFSYTKICVSSCSCRSSHSLCLCYCSTRMMIHLGCKSFVFELKQLLCKFKNVDTHVTNRWET